MDDDSAAVTAPLALPSEYAFGWHDSDEAGRDALRGLSEDVVRNISALKDEPEWMLNMRLKALRLFYKKPMPAWGADLSGIDFDRIKYFVQSTEKKATSWEELPEDIKNTYDRLGIPEAEKQRLVAGVSAQYESTSVYNSIREDLEKLGVIFMDTDTALREHEDLVRKYFATVIPPGDNKFAALNTAVWSGGSFVYIPPGVKVDIPLQAYFRINTESMGQFERTLIIADKDSSVHYVEGCLLKDGLIDMYDGSTKEMGDIVLGDKVYSSDGEPAVVTDTMVRPFEGLTYILATGSPGNSIEVTGEHPVMVIKRSRAQEKGKKSSPTVSGTPALRQVRSAKLKALTPEWVPAKDVDVGDFLVLPVEKRDESVEDLPVSLGKLAGYFLAEGSASLANGFPCLTFSLHEDETHLAEDIQELCLELYGARGSVTHVPKKHTITVSVFTKEGHAFMKENIGTRSYNKKLSPLLFHQRLEFTDAVVEGYMLGDGNIAATSETMTRVRASTVSKDWAFQLQKLVARQGYFASIRLERPSGSGVIMGCRIMRRYLWRVLWSPYSTEKRGSNPVRLSDAGFLVPVKSVTKSQYSGDVYNFETSPSHTYTSNAVLVHNCTAPIYDESSLHSAVVEIVLLPGATCRYTTIQNWSDNVYNLVTKRALAQAGATMEWIDANIGCVASGAVVSTPSGPRVIEALRPGDLVSSLNQATGEFEYKKVTAVINNGSRPTIEVSSSGNSIRVTEEHPFLASMPSKKNGVSLGLSWLPAASSGGKVVIPLTTPGAVATGLPSGLAFSDVRIDLVPVLAETWDIEVEDNENFVCNGFVVHNSKVTMKYPAVWMTGEYARGETLSIALAGHGQHQDAGSKMVHAAPNTSSAVVSKSVARAGGRTSYRGLVQILPGATNSKSTVRCDALLIDDDSRSDTYPYVDVREDNVSMGHEATVSKVSADQLFYLMTRGLTEAEAMAMIVRGFIEPIAKELPMEYALELNRLIELQMDGSVG